MANRAMKQKQEKANRLSREAGDARKYGVEPAKYREEMVNKYAKGTPRPSKAERESEAVEGAATFKATGEKRAAINTRRAKEGKKELKPEVFNPTGREATVEKNEAAIAGKEYISGAKKRAAKSDSAVSKVDLTPAQKELRKSNVQKRFAKEKAAKAKGTPISVPAEAPAKPSRPAQLQPGEGKAGILDTANIARQAGDMLPRKRRKMERKAAYNVKNAGKTPGYTKAARLAQDTADAVNTKNTVEVNTIDRRARSKAGRLDATKDYLKAGLKKGAAKLPDGPVKEAVTSSAETLIRDPLINGKRGGLHAEVTRPDDRNITKSYTRVQPVGGVRKTEITHALSKEKIQMNRGGEISTQPDRPVETGMGLMGTHEDRLHKITKDFQVPAGDTSHPLEHVHLRSFLRHKSESRGTKYNEQGAVAAVWHAKQTDPKLYADIHKQALEHRTKRIGQVTQQRERSRAKAKENRAIAAKENGGKRKEARVIRVISNVQNRFTEVPRGGSEA
jgi:hypothetical protein